MARAASGDILCSGVYSLYLSSAANVNRIRFPSRSKYALEKYVCDNMGGIKNRRIIKYTAANTIRTVNQRCACINLAMR